MRTVSRATAHAFAYAAGTATGKVVAGTNKIGNVVKTNAQTFLNGAKSIYKKFDDKLTANKKMVRSTVRRVKEGVVNFGYKIKNGIEDKAYDTGQKLQSGKKKLKGFFNKISKSVQGKIDTVHYGLLVAKDGVTNAVKPVRTVSRATAHAFAYAAGTAAGKVVAGTQKATESVKKAGTIIKVSTENAKKFISDKATKVTYAGKNFGKKITSALRQGGERAYGAVTNTLSKAGKSINKQIEQTKQNIENTSRQSSSAWFKVAYAKANNTR